MLIVFVCVCQNIQPTFFFLVVPSPSHTAGPLNPPIHPHAPACPHVPNPSLERSRSHTVGPCGLGSLVCSPPEAEDPGDPLEAMEAGARHSFLAMEAFRRSQGVPQADPYFQDPGYAYLRF